MTVSTKKHTTLLGCIDEMCNGGPILAGARPYHRLRKEVWGDFDRIIPKDLYLFWFDSSVSTFVERYGDQIGLRYASPEMYHFVKTNGKALNYKHSKQSRVFIVSTKSHLLDSLFLLRAELEIMIDYHESLLMMDFYHGANFLRTVLQWPSSKFIKFAKYHTAAPIAFCLENPLPENPSSEFFPNEYDFLIWKGPIRKFLRQRLRSHSLKSVLPLWWGFLQGVKRGCSVVSEDFILGSMIDHAELLSVEAPSLDSTLTSRWTERIDMFYSLVPPEVNLALSEPSRKASTQNPMSMGGTREFLYSLLAREKDQLPSVSMDWESLLFKEELTDMVQTAVDQVKEERGRLYKSYNRRWLLGKVPHNPLSELTYAKVSSVLEPLKVRLITKTDGIRSTLVKPIQEHMWEYNSRWPQFRLTTQPLEETHLLNVLQQEENLCLSFFGKAKDLRSYFDEVGGWVSGDYSSATDRLNMNFTKELFESFLSGLLIPDDYKKMCRDILYEQTIFYPQPYSEKMYKHFLNSENPNIHCYGADPELKGDRDFVTVTQKNGQLMGSILSFPVLCVANFICYWIAFDEWRNEIFQCDAYYLVNHPDYVLRTKPIDLPVLINGDDILFRADNRLYSIWQKTIEKVGFKLSIGKNYMHRSVLTVNSELWTYRPGRFQKLGYLNVGLLQGRTKLGSISDSSGKFDKPLNDQYALVVRGANNGARAHRRFLHYRRREIDQVTKHGRYNLFLPTVLYGLGFVPDFVSSSCMRVFHHRLASYKFRLLERSQEKGFCSFHRSFLDFLLEKVSYVREDLAPTRYPFKTHHYYVSSVSLKTDVPRYDYSLELTEGVMPPLYQRLGGLSYESTWKVKYPTSGLKKAAWIEKNPKYVSWDRLHEANQFQIRIYPRRLSDYTNERIGLSDFPNLNVKKTNGFYSKTGADPYLLQQKYLASVSYPIRTQPRYMTELKDRERLLTDLREDLLKSKGGDQNRQGL